MKLMFYNTLRLKNTFLSIGVPLSLPERDNPVPPFSITRYLEYFYFLNYRVLVYSELSIPRYLVFYL
jgi:hypothetical protein